jgi:hypothetical protein
VLDAIAWYYCWLAFGDRWLAHAERDLFRRLAFITRYTANSYHDFMAIPLRDVELYAEAVAALIEEEKPVLPPVSGR